ncbi:hypothetical protein G7Y89_g14410 [Cudoniella acicularis]|uniref:RING-type domain-containing protein n=1 Tax=Cudoniella acicularis TaxID=354080 RepID=A0A8H4R210_9HELO|nr:hypothetical protein G7Y89_g14410 [Cudoniella acicularis]
MWWTLLLHESYCSDPGVYTLPGEVAKERWDKWVKERKEQQDKIIAENRAIWEERFMRPVRALEKEGNTKLPTFQTNPLSRLAVHERHRTQSTRAKKKAREPTHPRREKLSSKRMSAASHCLSSSTVGAGSTSIPPCPVEIHGFKCGHYTTEFQHRHNCPHFQRLPDSFTHDASSSPPIIGLPAVPKGTCLKYPQYFIKWHNCQWCAIRNPSLNKNNPALARRPLLHNSYRSDPSVNELPKEIIDARIQDWMDAVIDDHPQRRNRKVPSFYTEEGECMRKLLGEAFVEKWWEEKVLAPRRRWGVENTPLEERTLLYNYGREGEELMRRVDADELRVVHAKPEPRILSKLFGRIWKQDDDESDWSPRLCGKCVEVLDLESARKLPCGHIFHEQCLKEHFGDFTDFISWFFLNLKSNVHIDRVDRKLRCPFCEMIFPLRNVLIAPKPADFERAIEDRVLKPAGTMGTWIMHDGTIVEGPRPPIGYCGV